MQLVFHTGAHFTEEERLMKCLLRNKEALGARGIFVPGPSKYRKLLRQILSEMADLAPSREARDILLEAILENEHADRVLLSNAHFFGAPRAAVQKGALYPMAPERVSHIADIFHEDHIELFMAIRNPATFLPACFGKSSHETMNAFMGGRDPRAMRWSDTLIRMRAAAPEIPITVWCNEDAPLLWSQIIREIAGLDHGDDVVGGFDLLADIISKEGMMRFSAYRKTKPDLSEIQLRRVMAAFVEKFGLDAEIDEEIDVPGWTDALVSELTDIYDEDVFAIERIPGVQLISP
jgi:hypothetical protein